MFTVMPKITSCGEREKTSWFSIELGKSDAEMVAKWRKFRDYPIPTKHDDRTILRFGVQEVLITIKTWRRGFSQYRSFSDTPHVGR
jgi:hypothetical protein